MAARAPEGKVLLWVAFAALLLVIVLGNSVQYLLARGPARGLVLRFGRRLGITSERLERVAARVQRGGVIGIAVAVLTPGVRSAAIPGCGLASIPLRLFVPGLALGSAVAHAALRSARWRGLLIGVVQSSPLPSRGAAARAGNLVGDRTRRRMSRLTPSTAGRQPPAA